MGVYEEFFFCMLTPRSFPVKMVLLVYKIDLHILEKADSFLNVILLEQILSYAPKDIGKKIIF